MQHTMNLDNKEFTNAIEIDQNGLSSNNNTNGILLNGKKESLEDNVEYVEIKSKTDREIVRLIGQHLRGLGLNRTAELLSQESGCKFDHPIATRFYAHVIEGDWAKAESDLNNLQNLLDNPQNAIEMKFLLLEQKYFEFLDEGRTIDALYSLRHEITTLNYNLQRVHELSRYIMCNNTEELHKLSGWEGKGPQSRQKLMDKLQNYLPPHIMLPPRRLKTLLNQSLEYQKNKCSFHNSDNEVLNSENFSLLTDHNCSTDDFPSETRQILTDHCDEVLYCQFSNDGTKLATGSKDNNIIIWEVNPVTLQCRNKFVLEGHTMGASFFVWSPNDDHIIACGPDESPNIWIWNVETGRLRVKVNHSSEDSLTACCFQSDGKRFFVGSIKGQFYLSDLDGNILDKWEGVRVQALATKSGDKRVLAADTQRRIKEYYFDNENSEELELIQEDHNIMSFTVDKTEELALLNVFSQGVHLWDLKEKILLKKYRGVQNGFYIIHSCFGGRGQNFIASGSEDCKVYIWHKNKEIPIIVLNGHSQTVNCVSWNPKYPHILASASDDCTVRIWGPSKKNQKNKNQLKCNGTNQKNKSSVLSNNSENNFNAAKPSSSSRSNLDCNQSASDTESNDPDSNSSSPLMA